MCLMIIRTMITVVDVTLIMIIIIIIIKCWMLSFIVCVWFIFFFKIFYILYKRKKMLLYFALLWTASHGAFINLSLCQFKLFMSYLLFRGGNKVTVNFKYWLKPYNLHMLCFASLMYTNGLILNQKKEEKKRRKKCSTLWSAFVSQSVCAGASGFTVVINSFVVAFTLFKMSLEKRKSAHILVFYCEGLREKTS